MNEYGRCQCGHSKTSHFLSEGVCEIYSCKCQKYRPMVVGDQVTVDAGIDLYLAEEISRDLWRKRTELWPESGG